MCRSHGGQAVYELEYARLPQPKIKATGKQALMTQLWEPANDQERLANQFKCQEVLMERLDILSGRNVGYWADPQAGKGVITLDQKEEIKREGEALTEHLEDLTRMDTRKAIHAQAKRWGAGQVANYRLRVARAAPVVVDVFSQGSAQEKAGGEFNDDEAEK